MGSNKVAMTVAPIIFAVVLVAVMQSADAETYKVGEDSGWYNPRNTSFYSNWASRYTFNLNDVLEFDFDSTHTLAQVSQAAYESCDTTSNPISYWGTGPVSVTLNTTGSFYLLCDFGSHCKDGQKLAVQVSTSSGTPSPPTGGTSTPPPPPPPPSSASSLAAAAATSVIFGLVYVVGLFMN